MRAAAPGPSWSPKSNRPLPTSVRTRLAGPAVSPAVSTARIALGTERQQHIVQIMTTEHFTLQTARGNTVAETNGRVGVYLRTVSTTLVALAFIGQISHLGPVFSLFGLILFASVFFLGLFTFARLHPHVQPFLTTAGLVAVIDSIVAGGLVGGV